MAEDSIDVPEPPEKVVELKDAHPRRYSTGNLSLAKGGVDVLPRYLGGASVTSCHDLCKYGIKHEPEEKPWLRKSRRNLGEQRDLVKDVLTIIVEGKKKPIFKNELPASPKKVVVSSPYSSSPTAKNASSLRPKSLERTSSVPGDSRSRREVTEGGKAKSLKNSSAGDLISTKKRIPGTNKLLRKVNTGKDSGSVSTNKELGGDSGNFKKRNTSQPGVRRAVAKNPNDEDVPEKIIYTVDTKQPLTPSPENKKLKQIQNGGRTSLISALSLSPRKTRPTRNEQRSSSPLVKLHSRPIKKAESEVENHTDDCQVKNIDSVEDPVRTGDEETSPSQPLSSSPGDKEPLSKVLLSPEAKKSRRTRNGTQASPLSSSSSLKKILTPVRKGSSSSSSSTPSLKLRARSNLISESESKKLDQVKYTARPKRVKIVRLEDKVRVPKKLGTRLGKGSSPSSPSHLVKNVEIDPNSGGSGSKSESQTPDLQVERSTGRPRRVRSAGLGDEAGSSPKKLHFRRGKVVDIQPRNAIIPRILKFKQRISLAENQSGRADAWRTTMKKLVGGDDSNGFSSGTVKVALRHQSVEGKKEGKSLFNNVIEETATLLAQTRKSKVKALVGAFETVISLQDKKKSSSTT